MAINVAVDVLALIVRLLKLCLVYIEFLPDVHAVLVQLCHQRRTPGVNRLMCVDRFLNHTLKRAPLIFRRHVTNHLKAVISILVLQVKTNAIFIFAVSSLEERLERRAAFKCRYGRVQAVA